MPMVWYIPPLSPVVDVVQETGEDAEDRGNLFAAIDTLRIPVEYLANLFTAGDVEPVDGVLKKLAAMRSYMRDINLGPRARRVHPRRRRHDGGGDVRDVPPARDRQVRRPLRHPAGPRRAGARAGGAGHRLLGRLRRGWFVLRPGTARRGRGLPDAGRGGELPDAPGPADLRHARRAGRQGQRGSTSSTGTARAPPRGCSRPATTEGAREVPPPPGAARARRRRPRVGGLLGAPRLPDRGAARLARRPRGAGARTPAPDAAPRPRAAHAARAAPAGLCRHLRPHPQVRALPDLLRLRRHPAARRRARAVQGGLPAGRGRVGRRPRRAARPPLRGAAVRRDGRRRHRPARCSTTTAPAWRCCASRSPAGATTTAPPVAVGRRAGGPVRHPARARRGGGRRRTPSRRAGPAGRGGRPRGLRRRPRPGVRPRPHLRPPPSP